MNLASSQQTAVASPVKTKVQHHNPDHQNPDQKRRSVAKTTDSPLPLLTQWLVAFETQFLNIEDGFTSSKTLLKKVLAGRTLDKMWDDFKKSRPDDPRWPLVEEWDAAVKAEQAEKSEKRGDGVRPELEQMTREIASREGGGLRGVTTAAEDAGSESSSGSGRPEGGVKGGVSMEKSGSGSEGGGPQHQRAVVPGGAPTRTNWTEPKLTILYANQQPHVDSCKYLLCIEASSTEPEMPKRIKEFPFLLAKNQTMFFDKMDLQIHSCVAAVPDLNQYTNDQLVLFYAAHR